MTSDAAPWCDVCRRYHPRRDVATCRAERRSDRERGDARIHPVGIVVSAVLAGFGAGQLTNSAEVALVTAAIVGGLATALWWRQRR